MKILAKYTEIKIEIGHVRISTLLCEVEEEIEIQRHLLTEVLSAREREEIEENLREALAQKDNLVALLNVALPVGNLRKAT